MKYWLFLFFMLFFVAFSWAQIRPADPSKPLVADTVKAKPVKKPIVRPKEISLHAKAALLSAVLPGAGQAFNKKYWKMPFVYAGATGFGWAILHYNKLYVDFRNALVINTDGDPNTQNVEPYISYDNTGLKRVRDAARRYRDLNIMLSTAFYGLQIADALADAHLKSFDVSDDLSLRPSMLFLPNGKPVMAMSVKYQF